MIKQFEKQKIIISNVYHCPHQFDFNGKWCRKPNTKMIADAKNEFNLDLKNLILIGINFSRY